jgi:hypothetical protein
MNGGNHLRRTRASVLAAVFIAATACEVPPPEGTPARCTDEATLPASFATDILFVIDDSNSMRAAQEKVAAQLEVFIATLAASPLHNDFQIGVVTTGVTMHARTCNPAGTPVLFDFPEHDGRLQRGKDLLGQVLDPTDDKILRFDHPDLLPQARRLLGQGIAGSPQEMGLEAMRLALTEPRLSTPLDADPPGNAGFLRPGSRLMVIVVSDEDDCSDPTGTAITLEPVCGGPCETDADCDGEGHYCLPGSEDEGGVRRCQHNPCETPEGRARLEPVERYVDFLRTLDDGTGRPREVFLAVIGAVDVADPTIPARCGEGDDEAHGRAVRYVEAVEAMGAQGYVDSICREDFGQAMVAIAALLEAPQVLSLNEAPVDGRLLDVRVERPDGTELLCRHGEGFVYHPPSGDVPARLEMLEPCRVAHGDRVAVNLLCAG